MDRFFKFLLVCSNVLLAAAFSYHWLRPVSPPSVRVHAELPKTARSEGVPMIATPQVVVEMKPVEQGITSLEKELSLLRADLRRLNLTALQFAYLGRELDGLEKSAQQASERLREARMVPQKDLTPEAIKAIARISELQKKIDSRTEERRKLLGDLVRKLEIACESSSSSSDSSSPPTKK
ncbi:MAG: hypothetical protein QM627_02555 [Luteolibacter sp.]